MKRIIWWSLVIFLLLSVTVYTSQAGTVKIAVAADGKRTAGEVSYLAGRCPYYLIFDGGGKLITVIDNPHKDVIRRAGPKAASFLAQEGVTILIAGACGSKMISALKDKNIKYIQLKGNAVEAVKKVLADKSGS